MKRSSIPATLVLMVTSSPAFAHLNPAEHGSFAAGFTHPLTGADHILAMVAVGLWAAMLGGRALYAVPLSFVGVMVVGFVAALWGLPLPYVEPVILASVIVIGLLVALAFHASTRNAALIVGFFAFFHGYAHGGEIGSASFLSYATGFALATALLHVSGIAVGLALGSLAKGRSGQLAVRVAGSLAALSGVYLAIG
ncbi:MULTISPECIES: HupE/UreJ family protein [Ochrobactrum]|uniref:HupE/UreJ family protein n=1 Tax=Ochrobactrum quorumnocens TaxID=271865 RepID=A0A5N1JSB6_9HYPH|nr:MULTISPECIES: HupE/UreJ family protein [Brucella/Ochrobactrum group]KAA9367102.1 HupE/UreJ family protein [[Ochrobactrum] quorumnocens]MDH7793142.1 urease accessory protein [Ochrobactrum sp. AN78]